MKNITQNFVKKITTSLILILWLLFTTWLAGLGSVFAQAEGNQQIAQGEIVEVAIKYANPSSTGFVGDVLLTVNIGSEFTLIYDSIKDYYNNQEHAVNPSIASSTGSLEGWGYQLKYLPKSATSQSLPGNGSSYPGNLNILSGEVGELRFSLKLRDNLIEDKNTLFSPNGNGGIEAQLEYDSSSYKQEWSFLNTEYSDGTNQEDFVNTNFTSQQGTTTDLQIRVTDNNNNNQTTEDSTDTQDENNTDNTYNNTDNTTQDTENETNQTTEDSTNNTDTQDENNTDNTDTQDENNTDNTTQDTDDEQEAYITTVRTGGFASTIGIFATLSLFGFIIYLIRGKISFNFKN